MAKIIDLTGQKFGKLFVIKRAKTNRDIPCWECLCECGNPNYVITAKLLNGHTKSCGCLHSEVLILRNKASAKHGFKGTRFYSIWHAMKSRAGKMNNYKDRLLCDEWRKFENFRDDMYDSYLQHVQEFGEQETTIDRVKNNLGYYKENCRWATIKIQARNKSTNRLIRYKNRILCLSELSEVTGISRDVLKDRLNYGWSVEDAVSKPIRSFKKLED